jgi:uncharacterized membrane protein YfcA
MDGVAITGIPVSQVALSLLFGTMVGLLLGLVGGGGSILTVPILVYVIGLDVHAATATSLAIVGTSALAGAIPHARAGRVNGHVAVFFGLVGIAGAFAGTWLNHLVVGTWVLLLFGVLMLVVAFRMWLRQAPRPPVRADADEPGAVWKIGLAGLVVGVLTGFFGVGGGFLIVPALALALGMPMAMAVGTSLLIIAINSVSGLAAHLGTGGFDLPVALCFIAGGLGGGLAGGRLAGTIDERALSRAFSFMVGAVGVYLIVQNALVVASGLALANS